MKVCINRFIIAQVCIAFLLSGPAHSEPYHASLVFPAVLDGNDPAYLTVFNSKLYFVADDGKHGKELWLYNGKNSPVMVADINPTISAGSNPANLTVVDSKLYFRAHDGEKEQLWVYDGVTPPKPTGANVIPSNTPNRPQTVAFNSKLYFTGNDGVHGIELWEYDGINQPTMVADINPEPYDDDPLYDWPPGCSWPGGFKVINSKLYFNALNGEPGSWPDVLYVYDGINPPVPVRDLAEFIAGDPILFQSKLYFVGQKRPYQYGNNTLWAYDWTNPPVEVSSISPNLFYSVIFNSKLYFEADDGVHGKELWEYDGVNPPVMAADINPSGHSKPWDMTIVNSTLYFSADDGVHGKELWKYDGVNPPVMAADINPEGWGFPFELTSFQSKLFFKARPFISSNPSDPEGYLWVYKRLEHAPVAPWFKLLLKGKTK